MPRFDPNSRFSDCWSSVGNVTFFHRDGVCFWKKKPVCEFTGTPGQMEQLELHRRALMAWKTLDHDVQLKWNAYAASAPSHRPPFDSTAHITGHNLFVSAYHGFAQLGEERVPEPQAFEDFPVFFAEFSSVEAVGESDLILYMHVLLGDTLEPERYRLMTKIQFTSPGRGRQPGYMRSHIASANCLGNDCIVQVPVSDYASKWELDLNSYQIHMRYLLIDTVTGYRSQCRRISFLMGLEMRGESSGIL